eukprot:TRINITY_DN26811_c0_g1_i2.p1 TRINITY_DN26811_c0_g1~~TRINITY_DN26811_c0_g1_i2.p1  ORF type:complete len:471 (+),score=78.01 TRINITY_DN26811_c0_g1_i2:74-1486(+)
MAGHGIGEPPGGVILGPRGAAAQRSGSTPPHTGDEFEPHPPASGISARRGLARRGGGPQPGTRGGRSSGDRERPAAWSSGERARRSQEREVRAGSIGDRAGGVRTPSPPDRSRPHAAAPRHSASGGEGCSEARHGRIDAGFARGRQGPSARHSAAHLAGQQAALLCALHETEQRAQVVEFEWSARAALIRAASHPRPLRHAWREADARSHLGRGLRARAACRWIDVQHVGAGPTPASASGRIATPPARPAPAPGAHSGHCGVDSRARDLDIPEHRPAPNSPLRLRCQSDDAAITVPLLSKELFSHSPAAGKAVLLQLEPAAGPLQFAHWMRWLSKLAAQASNEASKAALEAVEEGLTMHDVVFELTDVRDLEARAAATPLGRAGGALDAMGTAGRAADVLHGLSLCMVVEASRSGRLPEVDLLRRLERQASLQSLLRGNRVHGSPTPRQGTAPGGMRPRSMPPPKVRYHS